MADAADSKSVARKGVWVRLPPPAPHRIFQQSLHAFTLGAIPKKTVLSFIESV